MLPGRGGGPGPNGNRFGSGSRVKSYPAALSPAPLQKGVLKVAEAHPPPRELPQGHRDTSLLPKKNLLNAHTKFILVFADSVWQEKTPQCHLPPAQQGDHRVGPASLQPPDTPGLTLPMSWAVPSPMGSGVCPGWVELQSVWKHQSVLEGPTGPRRDVPPHPSPKQPENSPEI